MINPYRRYHLQILLFLVFGRLYRSCDTENHFPDNAIEEHTPITQRLNRDLKKTSLPRLNPRIELCGIEEPSAELIAIDQANMRFWQVIRDSYDMLEINYTVPTYFHFLQYNSSDLFLSDSNVTTYMNYLNNAFNKSNAPFRFPLMGITRTINATWSNNCGNSTYQKEYRTLLRRGGKETMNVYVCNTIPAGPNGGYTTGFATMPSANIGVTDGVTIVRSTPTDVQRQNTLVHEVGHFLGLHHTFKDNCNTTYNGDLVDDTPYHISLASTVNCKTSPTTWDTCPTLSGLDPVDNYMTYSTDSHGCRTRFTSGQVARMVLQFEMYRYSASIPVPIPVSAPIPMAPPTPITAPSPNTAPRSLPVLNPVPSPMIAPVPNVVFPTPVVKPVPSPSSGTCKKISSSCKFNIECCSSVCKRKRCV